MAAALPFILVQHLAHFADFHQRIRDKALSAKTRIDRHQQHHIQFVQNVFQNIDRRSRIQYQTCLTAVFFNQTQAAVDMAAGFGMESNDIGTGFGKCMNQIVYRLNHQMYIDRHGCIRFQSRANHRAEGQIRHIMIVHHVKMNQIRTGADNFGNLFAQAGKISGQNTGGNTVVGHVYSPKVCSFVIIAFLTLCCMPPTTSLPSFL